MYGFQRRAHVDIDQVKQSIIVQAIFFRTNVFLESFHKLGNIMMLLMSSFVKLCLKPLLLFINFSIYPFSSHFQKRNSKCVCAIKTTCDRSETPCSDGKVIIFDKSEKEL